MCVEPIGIYKPSDQTQTPDLRVSVSAVQFAATVYAVNHTDMMAIESRILANGATKVLTDLKNLLSAIASKLTSPASVVTKQNVIAALQVREGGACSGHFECGQDSGLGFQEELFCDASKKCNQCFNCRSGVRGICIYVCLYECIYLI